MNKPDYMREPEYDYYNAAGNKVLVPDVMMWVGDQFYTLAEFLEEVRAFGVSKRIRGIPDALVPGETRLFLVHPSAIQNPNYDPNYDPEADPEGLMAHTAKEYLPGIFSVTYINQVQLIVNMKDEKMKEKWEKLKKLGVTAIPVEDAAKEHERGCGFRKPGALYLVTPEDFEKVAKEGAASNVEVKGGIAEMEPPIPLLGKKLWRGIAWVDGDAILGGFDQDTWFLDRERLMPGSYWCTKCQARHRRSSAIGKEHQQFEGKEPKKEESPDDD